MKLQSTLAEMTNKWELSEKERKSVIAQQHTMKQEHSKFMMEYETKVKNMNNELEILQKQLKEKSQELNYVKQGLQSEVRLTSCVLRCHVM